MLKCYFFAYSNGGIALTASLVAPVTTNLPVLFLIWSMGIATAQHDAHRLDSDADGLRTGDLQVQARRGDHHRSRTDDNPEQRFSSRPPHQVNGPCNRLRPSKTHTEDRPLPPRIVPDEAE